MSALPWVVAPLLAIAAYLLLRKLIGRAESRHRTNVILSLVLLGYFLATAGLGIFWVARQQLPVFDLHYLVGYVALALVIIHVSLNARVVVRTFAGPPRKRAKPKGAARYSRAAVYAAVLGLVAVGAYAAGASAGSAPSWNHVESGQKATSAVREEVVRRYHTVSSESRTGAFARAPVVSWNKPPPFKQYPDDQPRVALPPPGVPDAPPLDALILRGDDPGGPDGALDLAGLAAILHHTCGVTARRGGLALRAAPSSGALFPGEVYVAARAVDGLGTGLYHFDPGHHQLVKLSTDAPSAAQLGHPGHPGIMRAPATVIVTAIFARTGYKYGHRAYRYILADLGHLLENLRLAARAMGWAASTLSAFAEAELTATLSLDPHEEAPLAVVPLMARAAPARIPSAAFRPAKVDPSHPLGPTGVMHTAASLQLVGAAPSAGSDQTLPLPDPDASQTTVWQAIRQRRSVRSYAAELMPASTLAALLASTSGPSSVLSNHVGVFVVAHRVQDIPDGAYRYDPRRHELSLVQGGDLASATQSAMLSQEMGGRAAAVIVLTVDGEDVLQRGARAYRHAWLEVGMMGERVYLAAAARGLGACAAGAFFDDEAAALLALPDAKWVAHFVSVGLR